MAAPANDRHADAVHNVAAILGDVHQYDKLVSHRVRGLASTSPVLDGEDMRQAAWLGLCKAAARWDPERHAALQTYAYWRMRGEAIDELRRINGTRRRFTPVVQSLDRAQLDGSLVDPASSEAGPEELLDERESASGIWAELDAMPEPHRSVITALFRGGATLKQLCAETGISQNKASTLRAEGLEWLRYRLEHVGAGSGS